MARRRVADWKKLSQRFRHTTHEVKLVWFGVLGSVDDYGLCSWSPLQIGQMFLETEINSRKLSVRRVEDVLASFATGRDPQIIRYEHEGQQYLAVVKHQDYQRVNKPANADCPCPAAQMMTQISPRTRRLVRGNIAKFTSFCDGSAREFLAKYSELFAAEDERRLKGKEEEVEEDAEEPDSRAESGCPFCRHPTKGPLQHYHDEAKRVLKRCLVIPPAKAGPAISRVEAQVGQERAHALFAAYLASEDPFVLKQGHSLLTFASESIQNGLTAAVDGGFTHGSKAGTVKPRSRW